MIEDVPEDIEVDLELAYYEKRQLLNLRKPLAGSVLDVLPTAEELRAKGDYEMARFFQAIDNNLADS